MKDSRWKPEDRALMPFAVGGLAAGTLRGALVGAVVGRVGLFAPIGMSVGIGLGTDGSGRWRDVRRR